MSRSSAPVLTSTPPSPTSSLLLPLLPVSLLLLHASMARAALTASDIGCSLKSCAPLDVKLLQEYVTSLNTTTTTSTLNDTDVNGRPSISIASSITGVSVDSLPFGVLDSDWSRLELLQNRQPEGTLLRDNLLRLSRLMLAAYFESVEHNDWMNQTYNDGGDTTTTMIVSATAAAAVETESEDQQANNATLSSTTQKGSTWINASSVATVTTTTITAYNNEKEQQGLPQQADDGKFTGNKENSTTMSYHEYSTAAGVPPQPPLEATNFNQTFYTSRTDNEASGNNSNKTFVTTDNKDESDRGPTTTTAPTSGDFFNSSTMPPSSSQLDKSQLNGEIILGDQFVTQRPEEKSAENEAIHQRSKEDFVVSRHRHKGTNDKELNDEDDERNHIKNVEDFESKINKSAEERKSEVDSKFVEDFFAHEEDANNNNETDSSSSMEMDSFEFNSTKSIEEFFASSAEQNLMSKQETNATKLSTDPNKDDASNFVGKSTEPTTKLELCDVKNFTGTEISSNESLVEDSMEELLHLMVDQNVTNANVEKSLGEEDQAVIETVENVFRDEAEDKSANKLTTTSESTGVSVVKLGAKSNETLDQSLGELNENSFSTESIVNEMHLANTLDSNKLEITTSTDSTGKNDTLNSDELISSDEFVETILDSVESNSTTVDDKKKDNPTTTRTTMTLAQLITGRFSTEAISTVATVPSPYSNEITPAFDLTTGTTLASPLTNGTEDRYTKYPDATTTTISPSNTTTDQDKAMGAQAEPTTGYSEENRTTDSSSSSSSSSSSDDLFKEQTTTSMSLEEDWNSTMRAAVVSIRSTDDVNEASPPSSSVHLTRNILMIFRHDASSDGVASTAGELRQPEAKSWSENEKEDDTWELKEGAFNSAAAASLRNQQQQWWSNGIASGARMNKRKSRKRAGAELDVERQYRTFFGPELRQTQFAEKRSDSK